MLHNVIVCVDKQSGAETATVDLILGPNELLSRIWDDNFYCPACGTMMYDNNS